MYKEYSVEDGKIVNLEQLKSDKIEKEDYIKAHKSLPIACHDVFIEHEGGILLVIRENHPAKGILWPIGGRIQRGVETEESLKRKTKGECNLELEDIKFLGVARHFFRTEPFSHGKGTDTPSLVYFAKGKGELKLDNLHKNPEKINFEEFQKIKNDLHPYVRDFLEIAFNQ